MMCTERWDCTVTNKVITPLFTVLSTYIYLTHAGKLIPAGTVFPVFFNQN
ncbi:hypothetical protein [Actinobacillus delphinicola]|nr:hypothetical protein [Actinobacillus delphinicola]